MKVTPYHLLLGSFFALTAVLLGAFGAHGLKDMLSTEQLLSFETGVRYQMYHALALIVLSMKGKEVHLIFAHWITACFSVGIVLFSFSIYLLNLQEALGVSLSWLGPVTPMGGLLLIAGWSLLFFNAVRLILHKRK
ncbi:MAG: DUF423 domain-containing protein [Cryomorphaceae bacterium]